MRFYELEWSEDRQEIPLTVEQARQSITRATERFTDNEKNGEESDFDCGFFVTTDISGVDITGWEIPQ